MTTHLDNITDLPLAQQGDTFTWHNHTFTVTVHQNNTISLDAPRPSTNTGTPDAVLMRLIEDLAVDGEPLTDDEKEYLLDDVREHDREYLEIHIRDSRPSRFGYAIFDRDEIVDIITNGQYAIW